MPKDILQVGPLQGGWISVTNDRESILPHLAIGGEIVRRVNIPVIDLTSRNELIDLNCPRAFDLDGIDFLVFNNEVLAFCNLIPARRVFSGDNFTGLRIDVLLLQAVPRFSVDPVEAHLFAQRRRRIESNGTRNQRQPKVALPIRTRGH